MLEVYEYIIHETDRNVKKNSNNFYNKKSSDERIMKKKDRFTVNRSYKKDLFFFFSFVVPYPKHRSNAE